MCLQKSFLLWRRSWRRRPIEAREVKIFISRKFPFSHEQGFFSARDGTEERKCVNEITSVALFAFLFRLETETFHCFRGVCWLDSRRWSAASRNWAFCVRCCVGGQMMRPEWASRGYKRLFTFLLDCEIRLHRNIFAFRFSLKRKISTARCGRNFTRLAWRMQMKQLSNYFRFGASRLDELVKRFGIFFLVWWAKFLRELRENKSKATLSKVNICSADETFSFAVYLRKSTSK